MATAFATACSLVATLLDGATRRGILDRVADAQDFRGALQRLRDPLRRHTWRTAEGVIDLARVIRKLDRQTRLDGFHVLNDWDGVSDRVNADTIPVDVLDYVAEQRGSDPVDRQALAVLLDYHFMHLLALLSLHIWDGGDPDANLDRVGALLQQLQGDGGSGQRFADDPETLMLIATSHYELHERGYATLLDQVRTLNAAHQLRVALGHCASMGCHLRFGFEATYARDTVNMRDDNVADYPWLCYALATVMREYERLTASGSSGPARDQVAEALLNGLSGDARAFLGSPPPSLAASASERQDFAARFLRHRPALLAEFDAFRPVTERYSPLSFYFNFSHNVLKGAVVDALLGGPTWPLTLNDLLTSLGPGGDRKQALATTLMAYARANPHRIRGRLTPVIVYDPGSGREAFGITLRRLKE